jgi:Secretion system C-terminal sorting domain
MLHHSHISHQTLRALLLAVLCWTGLAPLSAQAPLIVYPGDANNNGVVNNLDFLQLGLGYNFVGPARNQATSAFLPQVADSWNFGISTNTAGALNFAYADCNGDGLINYTYDAFPIYVHYGRTHGVVTPDVYLQGVKGVDPQLFFDRTGLDTIVSEGEAISLPIHLGTGNLPVNNFYGIAFSILIDSTLVNLDSASVVAAPAGTWINNDGDRITSVYRDGGRRLDVAITRTDHNERSGFGRIGSFDYIIIVDVLERQMLPVILDSIYLTDMNGYTFAVAGDTITFDVQATTAPAPDLPTRQSLEIYPNPANRYLNLLAQEPIQLVRLTDLQGVLLLEQRFDNQQITLQLPPQLAAGMYLLETRFERATTVQKVMIKP